MCTATIEKIGYKGIRENYHRLAAIEATWDPQYQFQLNHNGARKQGETDRYGVHIERYESSRCDS